MPHLPRNLLLKMQAKVIVFEHLPVLRGLCGRTCISAKKPGDPADRPMPDLAEHSSLFGKVSVVIPCYNEASNIDRVTKRLLCLYGRYIHEIILVNDNSTDETAQVAKRLASRDPRIKLLNRTKPNGVGRALRDGYKAASGEYILSMDLISTKFYRNFAASSMRLRMEPTEQSEADSRKNPSWSTIPGLRCCAIARFTC